MFENDLSIIANYKGYDKKIISLDISKKYIGIALSDNSFTLAMPSRIIKRENFLKDLETLTKIFQDSNIICVVLGLPLTLEGEEEARVQSIKTFAINLKKYLVQNSLNYPMFFQDERYSTIFAKDISKNKQKQQVDDKAAAWFLQNFLDKIKILSKE